MTLQFIDDPNVSVADALIAAQPAGLLLETVGSGQFAVLPLDDDLLDYLLERNPRLIEDCRQIRDRMVAGGTHSHDDVRKLFDAK